jgi:hypothetical protein
VVRFGAALLVVNFHKTFDSIRRRKTILDNPVCGFLVQTSRHFPEVTGASQEKLILIRASGLVLIGADIQSLRFGA